MKPAAPSMRHAPTDAARRELSKSVEFLKIGSLQLYDKCYGPQTLIGDRPFTAIKKSPMANGVFCQRGLFTHINHGRPASAARAAFPFGKRASKPLTFSNAAR